MSLSIRPLRALIASGFAIEAEPGGRRGTNHLIERSCLVTSSALPEETVRIVQVLADPTPTIPRHDRRRLIISANPGAEHRHSLGFDLPSGIDPDRDDLMSPLGVASLGAWLDRVQLGMIPEDALVPLEEDPRMAAFILQAVGAAPHAGLVTAVLASDYSPGRWTNAPDEAAADRTSGLLPRSNAIAIKNRAVTLEGRRFSMRTEIASDPFATLRAVSELGRRAEAAAGVDPDAVIRVSRDHP